MPVPEQTPIAIAGVRLTSRKVSYGRIEYAVTLELPDGSDVEAITFLRSTQDPYEWIGANGIREYINAGGAVPDPSKRRTTRPLDM